MLTLGSKFRLTAMALSTIGLCCPAVSSADPGTLQFSQATFDVYEGDGTVTIEVTRTGGSEGKVSVDYATSDGTATAGADYRAKSRVLKWVDGETGSKTFEVRIINDRESNEAYETFNIELSDPTGGASLGEATVTITDNTECGPGDGWVIGCPSGFDTANSSGTFEVRVPDCGGNGQKMKLRGPTTIFRGPDEEKEEKDGTITITIPTEMVSLELSGDGFTVRAGDGVGNLKNDGPLYSPGSIKQPNAPTTDLASDPALADSFFNVFFEIETPDGFGIDTPDGKMSFPMLYNKEPCHMESVIDRVPPLRNAVDQHEDAENMYACDKLLLYPSPNATVPVACLIHPRHGLSVELDYFTATASNGAVALEWATGTEKDNAGFKVWRGQPLNGTCSNDPNNLSDVQPITPLVNSQATGVSGATYTMTDSNVVSGNTYCYALEDRDFGGKSTFHLDDIVSAMP